LGGNQNISIFWGFVANKILDFVEAQKFQAVMPFDIIESTGGSGNDPEDCH